MPLAQGRRTALVRGLSNPAPTCSRLQWPLLSGCVACRGVHDRSRSGLAPPSPGARYCSFRPLPRVPHSRAALAIRTQRVSDIDGHARRLSRPAEACAATQDGSQTLDGQEHAVAREAGGVAPRVSTQPSALRLSTVCPLRRLTAPPNIARRSSRSHMSPGKSGHSGGVSSAQISLNIPPRPSSTTSAHTARLSISDTPNR